MALIWKPMDQEWRARCAERWKSIPQAYWDFRTRLLEIGGDEACLWNREPDLKKIQERGQLWVGDRVKRAPARQSACHANSAGLWDANRDRLQIATGYALSEDGMWRQHSWCVQVMPRSRPWVIETTIKRVAYFGFLLNEAEAKQFHDDNW